MNTTMLDRIALIIESYGDLTVESSNLGLLMQIRKELSVESFKYGVTVAEARKEYESVKGLRKVSLYGAKQSRIEDGIGKAETYAQSEVSELTYTLSVATGIYYGSKTILEQINAVLDSIKQDIAQLRQEERGSL